MISVNKLYIDLSGNGNLLSKDECRLLLEINYLKFEQLKVKNVENTLLHFVNKLITNCNNSKIIQQLEYLKDELFIF